MKYLIIAFLFIFQIDSYSQGPDSSDIANFLNKKRSLEQFNDKTEQTDTILQKKISEYNVFTFEHRIQVYRWQLFSSKIIFSAVMIIALAGLYLSYLQFRFSISRNGRKTKSVKGVIQEDSTIADNSGQTSIQIGKDGLKIDSAVIGLLILIISVAFLFFYLKYIFPIDE